MFAKRRADMRNLGFVLSINFARRAREVLLNSALRKHFSVLPHCRKPTAHSSTFGFCRHAMPKQKTKELEFCQRSIKKTC